MGNSRQYQIFWRISSNLKPMKKYFTKSLWLIIAALLVVSCSKEDGVMDSSSRSDKLEVSFNFFEKSISEIESRAGTADVAQAASPWITRADTDGKKNLSDCKQITELEIALFPEDRDTMYLVTQFSTDKNFGQVKLYVPKGNYKMVAIAASTDTPSKDNKVSIQSTRMAKWFLPMIPRAKQPVAGGFTESRAFGRLATGTFRAWYSIPRTPVIRMPATDTLNWAVPIRMRRTSVACQASTPVSSRVQNIRWK
jgi:hypothetical protein